MKCLDFLRFWDASAYKPKFDLRKSMVESAAKAGIKPTARIFKTTPKTVRKWLNRYLSEGNKGLQDQRPTIPPIRPQKK